MQEFKFKALIHGKLFRVDALELNHSGHMPTCISYGTIYPSGEYKYVPDVLLQYTGLKDKNKIEIYSGDIVESDGVLFEITFSDGAFEIWHNGDDFQGNLFRINSVCNIIGNIHLNPELLNGNEKTNN